MKVLMDTDVNTNANVNVNTNANGNVNANANANVNVNANSNVCECLLKRTTPNQLKNLAKSFCPARLRRIEPTCFAGGLCVDFKSTAGRYFEEFFNAPYSPATSEDVDNLPGHRAAGHRAAGHRAAGHWA